MSLGGGNSMRQTMVDRQDLRAQQQQREHQMCRQSPGAQDIHLTAALEAFPRRVLPRGWQSVQRP